MGSSFDESEAKVFDEWNISEDEVHSIALQKLDEFLAMWFDAYPKSRFSSDNLGKYEIIYLLKY